MTTLTLGRHQEEFTVNLARFLLAVRGKGFFPRLREVQRTPEQQKIYFETGKSKTLDASSHLKSLAADIYFFRADGTEATEAERIELAKIWKGLDPRCVWGGDWKFKDMPHFEWKQTA